jgi:transposase InsO family protein
MSQEVNGPAHECLVLGNDGSPTERSPAGASGGPPPSSPPPEKNGFTPLPATAVNDQGAPPIPHQPPPAPPSSPAAEDPESWEAWQPVELPDEDDGPGRVREPFIGEDLGIPMPRRRGPRLAKPEPLAKSPANLTPEQRLLILDTWRRSGLPAGDFATMVGMSKHTLYSWKARFEKEGPAGLMDKPKGSKSGRLPDITRRSILMLKDDHPDWGCQRISDVLMRGPGLSAAPATVASILRDEGYELVEAPTEPHPDKVRRFERATPNDLWQTDLFTFILKRQNRRVYLVAFMDDHSRYIVSYGLHASQSAALVIEVLRAGIASCGAPREVLTDNGSQYVTWRGTSAFAKELQRRGIEHVVASPRRPQTLGKVERFWGTLWRECLQAAVFIDLADAQARIGHFIDYYNFRRPHQGLDGLVPADRFFHLAPEVRKTLEARVNANALDLARNGLPKAPFYLTGQAGGKTFSVHAEGERVILSREGEVRQEVDLVAPSAPPESMPVPVCSQGVVSSDGIGQEQPLPPGVSMLDEGMHRIMESMEPQSAPSQEGGQP